MEIDPTRTTPDGSTPTDDDETLVPDGAAPERRVVQQEYLGLSSVTANEVSHFGSPHRCACPPQPLHQDENPSWCEQVKPARQCRLRVVHRPQDVPGARPAVLEHYRTMIEHLGIPH